MNTTRADYRAEVEAIAEDLQREPGDDWRDTLHAAVDGSAWVIYYHRAALVLDYSSNEAAWEDMTSWSEMATQAGSLNATRVVMAYYAMAADVGDAFAELGGEE